MISRFIESISCDPPQLMAAYASDNRRSLSRVLETLTFREEQVLRLRYGLDGDEPMSLACAGAELGVTQQRASQIMVKALNKLRHPSRRALLMEIARD